MSGCCGDCWGACLVGTVISCADCCTAPRRRNGDRLPARPVDASSVPRQLNRSISSWKASADAGAQYPVDSIVLDRLQQRWQKHSQRKHNPGVLKPLGTSKAALHQAFLQQLSTPLSPEQEAARQRLQAAFSQLGEKLETPDLMIKIVPDLDLLLFNSILTDNIVVSWNDLPYDDHGKCNRGFHKAQIQLNKALFYFERKHEVLGTLIHEMIHAFFMLFERPWDWIKGSKKEHHWFPELAEKIISRLQLEGFEAKHIL